MTTRFYTKYEKGTLFFIAKPGTWKFNYKRTMSDRQVLFARKFLRNRGPSRISRISGDSPYLEYYLIFIWT